MLGLFSWYLQVRAIGVLSGFFAGSGDWIAGFALLRLFVLEINFCEQTSLHRTTFCRHKKPGSNTGCRTKKKHQNHLVFFLGSGDWIRTSDQLINSQLLYH